MQRKTMFYQRFVNWIKRWVIIHFFTEHNLTRFYRFFFKKNLASGGQLLLGLKRLVYDIFINYFVNIWITRKAAMRRKQVFNVSTKYWYDRNKKWKMAVKKNYAIILVASVACTKFGVNRPKQTKVIEQKQNFYF